MQIRHRYTDAVLREIPGGTLSRANLSDANLSGANLIGANLIGANLSRAYLSGADLSRAYLSCADMRCADMRCANLSGADLSRAYLSGADLIGANLIGANLSRAYLSGAHLIGANLIGARLPHFQICPEVGKFVAWKATFTAIVKLGIPRDAARTSSLVGRKCRASRVKVLGMWSGLTGAPVQKSEGTHDGTIYRVGEYVEADKFDDDIRVECTHGIHFFITEREAWEYGGWQMIARQEVESCK